MPASLAEWLACSSRRHRPGVSAYNFHTKKLNKNVQTAPPSPLLRSHALL